MRKADVRDDCSPCALQWTSRQPGQELGANFASAPDPVSMVWRLARQPVSDCRSMAIVLGDTGASSCQGYNGSSHRGPTTAESSDHTYATSVPRNVILETFSLWRHGGDICRVAQTNLFALKSLNSNQRIIRSGPLVLATHIRIH